MKKGNIYIISNKHWHDFKNQTAIFVIIPYYILFFREPVWSLPDLFSESFNSTHFSLVVMYIYEQCSNNGTDI